MPVQTLEAGIVDSRVVALLDALARRYTIGVGVFKTGHSMRTRSGSISHHYYGRAVDISVVNEAPVSASNASAMDLVELVSRIEGSLRPDEIGHPFSTVRIEGGFSDADHDDHVHIGYD